MSGLISPVASRPKFAARQEVAPPKEGPRLVEAFAKAASPTFAAIAGVRRLMA